MSFRRTIILCFSIFGLGYLQAGELINPITISASRSKVPLEEVAGALTIITRDEIENRNAVYVSEVLQSVPGLNVSQSGGAGALTQVRLRGAEANQVLVLIDGIEANDPANGSEFNFAHLALANIERIEVLRGPQSSLWGSDALSGVINIITTRGTYGKSLRVKNSYGSEDNVEGGLNFLAGTDRFDISMGGYYIDSEGINIASNGNERDGYDNTTLNFSTSYQLYENTEIGLIARHTNANNEFDPGLPVDGFGETDTEQIYGRSFLHFNLFSGSWAHQLEAAITDTSNDNDDEFFGRSKTSATKEKYSYQTSIRVPDFMKLSVNQSLVLALEREQERFEQKGASFPGFDPNQRQKITNYGNVLEYRARMFEDVILSAAYRHDNNDEFDDQNTYRIGINYLFPVSNSKVYVTRATGAKNPTFTELFGFAPNNFIGNPNLKPEKSESWEVGLGRSFYNDALYIEAAVFVEDLIDEIQTIFLPTFQSTVINNDSRSDRDGVEISVHSQVNDDLSITGSYTYVDANEPDSSGTRRTEIRRPKNQWSGLLDYSFPGRRMHLNVNIDYVGDRRDIDFGTGNRVSLDKYTRVDLGLSYQANKSVKMFLQLKNLLDEEYEDVFGFETEEFSARAGIQLTL